MQLQDTPLLRAVRANDSEAVAIALARDERPDLRERDVRGRLDAMADTLRPGLAGVHGARRLGRVIKGVFRTLRFHGPDRYDDPGAHLIDVVLERRLGSPVALSVVLMGIARRLDVRLSGVAFPGHFMVRYEATKPVFIDPSSGAFPFPAESLLELAADELRLTPATAKRFLEPAPARTLAVRLLQNLQRSHEERGDLGRALLAIDRLYELTGATSLRADRGLRAAALGAPHGALDDLEAYLAEHRDETAARAAAALEPGLLDLN